MEILKYWQDRKVLITGGSAGLGLALARTADALGAKVAVVGRDQSRLKEAVSGSRIHAITADIADKEATYRIAGEAAAALGGIDVLINNASYLGETPLRLLIDSDCEDVERALTTNLVGPFRLTKAVLPAMLLKAGGLVVNISSDAAINAYSGWGAYGVSKAALDHLSRIFSAELRRQGVRFIAIDPGDMHTAMHLSAIPDADTSKLHKPATVAQDLVTFLPKALGLAEVRYDATAWRTILTNSSEEKQS